MPSGAVVHSHAIFSTTVRNKTYRPNVVVHAYSTPPTQIPVSMQMERLGPAPRAGLVFIPGYYFWNNGFVWIDPVWGAAPIPGAVWINPIWTYDGQDQWALQEGYWQDPAMPETPDGAAPEDSTVTTDSVPQQVSAEDPIQIAPPIEAQQQAASNPEPVATTAAPSNWTGGPRLYIDPQSGLESYVAAAIVKKHVPIVVTQNQTEARFILGGTIDRKTENTGSKIARCLFLYCVGIEGVQTVTVNLIDAQTQEVIWAYTVKKASANAFQSTAEAVAKHLKKFLEQRPL